jgi:hypothetical protein
VPLVLTALRMAQECRRRCAVDAVDDAANEWILPELSEKPWAGVRWIAVRTPVGVSHVVDVTDVLDRVVGFSLYVG